MIKIAKHAGFCKGVKRAIDAAKHVGEEFGTAVTLGPIVHNQFVVNYLSNFGVGLIESENDLDKLSSDTTVVLRSHGVPKYVYDLIEQYNLKYIDATCPFVKAVHKLANKAYNEGKHIIIVGDPKHPEVIGIHGWTDKKGYVVKNPEDINNLPDLEGQIVVVAQTTQTNDNWENITNDLKNRYGEIIAYNTICKATSERQTAAIELAKEVDLMLVVGSSSSSNTKKLSQVCINEGVQTYQIESKKDINTSWFTKDIIHIGITAGASTPDWVLKEVVKMVEEMQKNVNEMKSIEKGDVLTGTVTLVEDKQVTVDVGYKFDGIIPIGELSSLHIESAKDLIKIGDVIRVEVLKVNDDKDKLILSKKSVDALLAWEELENKFNANETIDVVIADVVKGGLVVDIGVRGFIPASHVETHYVEDFADYKGRTLKVKIIEFDKENNKVILSHKVVIEEETENLKKQTINQFKIGSIIEGAVQRITDFGAFVDINGVDGLVHVSELAWHRVDRPSDIVKEGDKVKVKILSIDPNNERISLSLKSAQPSPWESIEAKINIGDIIEGTVKRLVSFGAFVEIIPGIEGLVHISEISPNHIATPNEVLSQNQSVNVKVLDISIKDKRVSLSIKQTVEVEQKTDSNVMEILKNNEQSTYTLGEMIGDKLKHLK